MKIPKTMSTQHPDNVRIPFFSQNQVLWWEDEIIEAFYSFSHLACEEQMWDYEWKEVDNFVVKKLLTKYPSFFKQNQLWKDLRIILRVPNPMVEKEEAKILIETLESIPRSYDIAKLMYKNDIAPIFEVILPMTTDSESLDRIYNYYKNYISWKSNKAIKEWDITISEWIWEIKPETINVIPLFEDLNSMLNAHIILKNYLKDKQFIKDQRVFLARSDPAMNYWFVSSALMNKIALLNIYNLWKEIWVNFYPIIWVWCTPMRWNLRPNTVERLSKEYPSGYTFLIQSSFKYDNSPKKVIEAIDFLNKRKIKSPQVFDINKTIEIIEKYSKEFQNQVYTLANTINFVSKFVPNRRKRKLHIWLFWYSRKMWEIKLPRAIKFTAALYSIWLPPEILALNSLTKDDIKFIKTVYIWFEEDLKDALKYYNPENWYVWIEVMKELWIIFEYNKEHAKITSEINKLLSKNETNWLNELIMEAANIRMFLG